MKDQANLDLELTETLEKFNNLTNSTAYNLSTWNESLREDFTSQFSQFKHSFQNLMKFTDKFKSLYTCIEYEVPNYSMRRNNLMKSPYDKTKILTNYSQIDFTFYKEEMCRIEDNSDLIKWKVLSLDKNRYADVPSVCFVLNGPDSELVDLIDK